MALPKDAKARKQVPIFSGVLKYFPDALAEVAKVSQTGNDQHNPGQPLHWAREKSTDQLDACVRHLVDLACIDDGPQTKESEAEALTVLAQVAWRALAELQLRCERVLPADSAEMVTHAIRTNLPKAR